MLLGDPDFREHLRDLPTGYLLGLLADRDTPHQAVIREVLWERGLAAGEVDDLLERRAHSRFPPMHALWGLGRKITLASTVLVGGFNLLVCYRLMHAYHSLRGLLTILAVGSVGLGFFLGYKLSIHLYQGDRHRLLCGFPFAVGSVDLETCRETTLPKLAMLAALAGNAVVGVVLMLFPLLLLYHLLT
jgi:hypothetical protein